MPEINAKGGVKIIGNEAYVHPMTLPELEFLLEILSESKYKLEDVPKVLQVTRKLRDEYKLMREHLEI